jgi:hypothetical protein
MTGHTQIQGVILKEIGSRGWQFSLFLLSKRTQQPLIPKHKD